MFLFQLTWKVHFLGIIDENLRMSLYINSLYKLAKSGLTLYNLYYFSPPQVSSFHTALLRNLQDFLFS